MRLAARTTMAAQPFRLGPSLSMAVAEQPSPALGPERVPSKVSTASVDPTFTVDTSLYTTQFSPGVGNGVTVPGPIAGCWTARTDLR